MKRTVARASTLLVFSLAFVSCGLLDDEITNRIAPTVSSTFPIIAGTGVAINAKLAANFSRAMDPATLTTATFKLMQGGTPVSGAVTYVGLSATFAPSTNLVAESAYTATITTGARDASGLPLADSYVWSFTTGAGADITRPRVTFTTPPNAATAVPINLKPAVTFSEAMDPATINEGTFSLSGGGTSVSGGVIYFGLVATFTPTSALEGSTLYTATLNTGARDLAGNAMASPYSWTFTTGAAPDTTPPTVISSIPSDGTTAVAFNLKPTATFSEAMDATTLTTATFTLTGPGATLVDGAVTYIANIASFAPLTDLAAGTLFTATIKGGLSGAKDLAGNALVGDFVWTFTTGAAPDTTPPTVLSSSPAAGTANVAFSVNPTATFSEAMDATTLTTATFTLIGPGTTPVLGSVSYSGGVAMFTPSANLAASTSFTATIKGGVNGAKDLAGNALVSDFVWTFTTATPPDTTPPTVLTTAPGNTDVGLCISKVISANFSEALDAATITAATFTVTGPSLTPVAGTPTYDPNTHTAFFNENANLATNTLFTVTLSGGANGVKDLAGNALASDKVWTFTTGSQPCSPTGPISLGAVASFGVTGGGAGMTNSGTLTVVNGDIGTTGASTIITGFHDHAGANSYTETPLNLGNVTGNIYTAPPAPAISDGTEGTTTTFNIATAAVAAAQDAWTNTLSPAALPGGTDPNGGQLGGLTLAPGVYKSAGGPFVITGSDLTLDGQGDSNAIWILQAGTALTVGAAGAPRSIILTRGAQAKNVFWRVGTAATINAAGGGTMVGTIIANAAITFSTAANTSITTLDGRALGLQASVTMVNTVINVPVP